MGRHWVGPRCSNGRDRPVKSEAFNRKERFGTTRQLPVSGGFSSGLSVRRCTRKTARGRPGRTAAMHRYPKHHERLPETPDVDGRSRRPRGRTLCRNTRGLRSVPPATTMRTPATFERHEVRESLAGRLVYVPGGQLTAAAMQSWENRVGGFPKRRSPNGFMHPGCLWRRRRPRGSAGACSPS